MQMTLTTCPLHNACSHIGVFHSQKFGSKNSIVYLLKDEDGKISGWIQSLNEKASPRHAQLKGKGFEIINSLPNEKAQRSFFEMGYLHSQFDQLELLPKGVGGNNDQIDLVKKMAAAQLSAFAASHGQSWMIPVINEALFGSHGGSEGFNKFLISLLDMMRDIVHQEIKENEYSKLSASIRAATMHLQVYASNGSSVPLQEAANKLIDVLAALMEESHIPSLRSIPLFPIAANLHLSVLIEQMRSQGLENSEAIISAIVDYTSFINRSLEELMLWNRNRFSSREIISSGVGGPLGPGYRFEGKRYFIHYKIKVSEAGQAPGGRNGGAQLYKAELIKEIHGHDGSRKETIETVSGLKAGDFSWTNARQFRKPYMNSSSNHPLGKKLAALLKPDNRELYEMRKSHINSEEKKLKELCSGAKEAISEWKNLSKAVKKATYSEFPSKKVSLLADRGSQFKSAPRYICAEGGGGGKIHVDRPRRQAWETFRMYDLGNNFIALQSTDGHFITLSGDSGKLEASADMVSRNARYKKISIQGKPAHIALQANNRYYVCADRTLNHNRLVANRTNIGPWEKFRITDV